MTSAYTARAFAGDQDFVELFAFVSAATMLAPPHTYWHIGDMMWNTCFATEDERRRNIRLWYRDGTLQGFGWFEAHGEVSCFVDPALRGTGELEPLIFEWASSRIDRNAQPPIPALITTAMADDTAYIEYLCSAGFQRGEMPSVRMTRMLDDTIPAPHLPAGWTVRAVGDNEWEARVDLHRAVWHPSRHTLEKYHHIRAFPAFVPALDLVAVAPDGTFAAYAGGWLDPIAGIGLFEPVGTLEAYRRRGLSSAVLREGLRRMQALGAHTAWISTGSQNSEALSVYQAAGFTSVGEGDYRFTRPLL